MYPIKLIIYFEFFFFFFFLNKDIWGGGGSKQRYFIEIKKNSTESWREESILQQKAQSIINSYYLYIRKKRIRVYMYNKN
jgi:hypothetical protein